MEQEQGQAVSAAAPPKPLLLLPGQALTPTPTPTAFVRCCCCFFSRSLNVQIIPGERENFEVSEKRFDREVLNAGVQRELRRRSQFENSQDVKKRKVEEKKLRRRFMNRGRNTGPVSWDQYFGGDLANLNSQFGGEDLEFKFLQSETTIPCNAFDSLFSDEA